MGNSGGRHKRVLRSVLAVALALFTCLEARVALGAGIDVTGVDYYVAAGADASVTGTNTIDILSITGELGDTVFVNMAQGERVIADHLSFTLDAENAEQKGGMYVGAVSATISDFDAAQPYTVTVFADRAEKTELYQGAISAVWAELEGQAQPQLVAYRTQGKEERSFTAPGSVSVDGVTYDLSSDTPTATDPLTYAYRLADNADTADGSITYVDDEGNTLLTQAIEGIALGTHQTVSVPSVITVGEGAGTAYWRTVCFDGRVDAAYPGTKDFVISCKPLATKDGGNAGNFYFATIQLVDAEGVLLATDTLNVTGVYRYTAPARLYLTGVDGLVSTYTLGSNEALSPSGVLTLDPAQDNVTTGSATYTIVYDKLPSDAEATWTISIVNGAADPKSAERIISVQTKTVKPGETATFVPEGQLEVDGKVYVPVASTKDEYSFTYGEGASPLLFVYYVPDGYVAPAPYDIQVRYVNIATNEVLDTKTLTSRPELRDELEISSPASFTLGGEEYVRLDGQEQSLWHSYYSSNRVYTIYYRNVKDELSASVTITRLRVEYVDAQTTAAGGTAADDGGAADGAAAEGQERAGGEGAADGAATAAIPTDDLTVVNGADNALALDGEGRDTNTMRIEDDETPLASLGGSESVSSALKDPAIAGVISAIGVAVAAIVFFVVKRRKQQSEDAE